MNEAEFSRMKASAVAQMREMNARAGGTGKNGAPTGPSLRRTGRQNGGAKTEETYTPPTPEAPPVPPKRPNGDGLFGGLDLPFLERLRSEGDLALILGLLLILLSERSDKKLLFALLYILL